MQVAYAITPASAARAAWWVARRAVVRCLPGTLMIFIGLLLYFDLRPASTASEFLYWNARNLLLAGFPAVFAIILVPILFVLNAVRKVSVVRAGQRQISGTVDQDGIRLRDAEGNLSQVTWPTVKAVAETPRDFFMTLNVGSMISLPKGDLSTEQIGELRALIRASGVRARLRD